MKHYYSELIVLVIFNVFFQTANVQSQSTYFYNLYGTGNTEQALFMDKGLNGGMILGGYVTNSSTGADFLILKLDDSGNIVWRKVFGTSGEDWIKEVHPTSDGNYIAAARTDGAGVGSFDAQIIKFDSLGNIIWARSIGSFGSDVFWTIIENNSGSYVASGFCTVMGFGGNDSFINEYTAAGDLIWTSIIGNVHSEYTASIIQTSDSGYVMTGFGDVSPSLNYDVMLLKINSVGELLWCKNYGGINYDRGWTVREMSDGGFIICGQTYSWGAGGSDGLIFKTDSLGNLLWSKVFGFSGDDAVYEMEETSDGNYILTGQVTISGLGEQVLLMKIDPSGNLLWAKNYGLFGNERGRNVIEVPDGFFLGGWSSSNAFGADDVIAIKTDLDGNLCEMNIPAMDLLLNPVQIASADFPQGKTTGGTLTSQTFPEIFTELSFFDFCPFVPVELESFNSVINLNNVTLSWRTSTEINNLGFSIERKSESNEFGWNEIAFVEGRGNSTEQTNYSYLDSALEPGKYQYRLKQIDYNGTENIYELDQTIEILSPDKFELLQNYPNPFNPNTKIKFSLSESSFTTLTVYNSLGEKIDRLIHDQKSAGTYEVNFDGSSLPSGTYFYRLESGENVQIRKMILIK